GLITTNKAFYFMRAADWAGFGVINDQVFYRRFRVNLIEVDRQSCNQDGICAAVCPAGLIDFQILNWPRPAWV
ncbi:MAG: hypothetical protein KKE59_03285, partial [Proteobacteria bacterium]|nr:hypothetical protein [Pseudomonadota bacterium]